MEFRPAVTLWIRQRFGVADIVGDGEHQEVLRHFHCFRGGLALRWSFMGPFETIDLNAPGGVRDYAERYQGIYSGIFPSAQRRVDWVGPVMRTCECPPPHSSPRGAPAGRGWQ